MSPLALSVEETVELHCTACNYGRGRQWLGCAGCQRRVGVLYFFRDVGRLRCRRCLRLTYPTRRMTEAQRMEQRAHRLYARAGTHAEAEFHYKPRWMRWSTFNRLIDEAEAAADFACVLAMGCDSFTKRFQPELYLLVKEYRTAPRRPSA